MKNRITPLQGAISCIQHLFKKNNKLKGSLTVEAALVLPLFMVFCLQMISFISMIQLHSAIQSALHQESARSALRAYVLEKTGTDSSSITQAAQEVLIKNAVIDRVGRDYLDNSMIEGGSNGIRLVISPNLSDQDLIDTVLVYKVKPALNLLGFSSFNMGNRCIMKNWTGFSLDSASGHESDEEYVYITESGTVYHKNRGCSYLSLSIRSVSSQALPNQRSEDGSKYYPCEQCGSASGPKVFITDQGNRYHSSLNCSKVKRTIYVVKLSEAGGRGPCSRCSQ